VRSFLKERRGRRRGSSTEADDIAKSGVAAGEVEGGG
jgi:hypothetical protein